MNKDHEALVEAIHREALAQFQSEPSAPPGPASIPHTELPEANPGDYFYLEWNTYRREVARLLEEGYEGQFALIKGNSITAICQTKEEAKRQGLQLYPFERFLIHQIRAYEPLTHGPLLVRQCRS